MARRESHPEVTEHAWASHADRWPVDQQLRRAGWKIEARPKSGESLWRKGQLVLPQSLALAEVRLERCEANREGGSAY